VSLLPHIIPTALDLLFIVACIGLLATGVWVIPHTMRGAEMLRDGLWHLLGLILTGLTLMSVIGLLLRTAEMSDLPWENAFSVIPLVLSETHFGMTWLVRMVAVGVLWFGWWRIKKTKNGAVSLFVEEESKPSSFLYAMLLAMACVVWSVSASSHAADWGDFTLPEWIGWLHILAGSVWLGCILVFALVIRRRLCTSSGQAYALFATCADGISRLAGIALVLVLATGIYNVWRQLDSFSDLWVSGYGRIILFKLALVALMAALGASNRYFNLPSLRRESGILLAKQQTAGLPLRMLRRLRPAWKPRKGDALARQFGQRVMVEAWLALGVLICAALLGHAMPPKKHVDTARHVIGSDSEMHTAFIRHERTSAWHEAFRLET